MPASAFSAFIAYVKDEFGWSQAELARQLGCGRNQITQWRDRGCPRYIALACSALACRLPELFMPVSNSR